MSEQCDVVVLGMGTCGEDAALRLLAAGLDVVGVEARLIGGECPFWACLPSKFMIRSANLLTEARRADGRVGRVSVEPAWSAVASGVRAEVTGSWEDSSGVARFESRGGRFFRGWGKITAPRTVEVDGTEIVARRGIVVATGSQPMIPPVPGLSEISYWTNHEAIEAEELPESLAILGGGPVGCELGQVFARFGAEVTIIEGEPRLLRAEEPEASRLVSEALTDEGVNLRLGARAESVAEEDGSVHVTSSDGSTVVADELFVATGRKVDADGLGVDAAGAYTDRGFIEVDGRMRAANGMWAIGDVTGKGLLTHIAEYQSMIAIEDILGADPRPADYSAMPRATFTDPEVGAVGMTEDVARSEGHEVTVTVKDLRSTFRGWLHASGNTGTIKLVADKGEDRLLGATVVGPRATDVLGFLGLAVQERIPLANLVNTIYAFPSFYGGIGEAIGAYGRGVVRVLDPATEPMFGDPPDRG